MEDYTGLAAVAWELFSGEEPGRDHPFFARLLAVNPGPTLDVGCGTGRLLLPLLEAGHEVEGVEPSADMRAILHRRAADRGLTPVVHDQAMQALDLPRAYRIIFVPCGSFQLVLDRAEARETLRRFHAHLEPGGVLVLIVYPMWDVERTALGEWAFRAREPLPDGSELQKHARVDAVHLIDQTLEETVRYRRLRDGEVVEEQLSSGGERWYYPHELTLMLERAGFGEVRITGNYTDAAPTDGDHVLGFVATR